MTATVYPYLRPTTDAVVLGPWRTADTDGVFHDMPDHVPAWDYQTDLRLGREIRIDTAVVLEQAGLSAGTDLTWVCEWTASGSLLSGLLGRAEVRASSLHRLGGLIRGTDLGGSLILRTALIVGSDTDTPRPFVASRAGEVLIDEVVTVRLEDDDALFPISVCDFSAAGIDPRARWYLQTPAEPYLPTMGAVRLYLNAADRELVNAAVRSASPTPAQQRLIDEMRNDVTRQLVDLALLQPGWIDALPSCSAEPDSFGASLTIVLDTLFPGEPHQTLAAQRVERPGDFAARFQGALRRTGGAR